MQESESEDSDSSGQDNTSSGYQTSNIQSPSTKQSDRTVRITVQEFKTIIHCSDDYRDAHINNVM